MNLKEHISEGWEWTKEKAHVVWLFLKYRPLITCPFCKGSGGHMSGGYEPEWSECSECWHHWKELDYAGMRWFEGRLPVLWYVRGKLSIWSGLWYTARFRDLLRCKLGFHQWTKWEIDEKWAAEQQIVDDSRPYCCVCYKEKGEKRTAEVS